MALFPRLCRRALFDSLNGLGMYQDSAAAVYGYVFQVLSLGAESAKYEVFTWGHSPSSTNTWLLVP